MHMLEMTTRNTFLGPDFPGDDVAKAEATNSFCAAMIIDVRNGGRKEFHYWEHCRECVGVWGYTVCICTHT